MLTKFPELQKKRNTINGYRWRLEEGWPYLTEDVYSELRASDSAQKHVAVANLSMAHFHRGEKKTEAEKANNTNYRQQKKW